MDEKIKPCDKVLWCENCGHYVATYKIGEHTYRCSECGSDL